MRRVLTALALIGLALPAGAAPPPTEDQIVARMLRENPRLLARAEVVQRDTLWVYHRSPRGNMDLYAETLCYDAPPIITRIVVYDHAKALAGKLEKVGDGYCRAR